MGLLIASYLQSNLLSYFLCDVKIVHNAAFHKYGRFRNNYHYIYVLCHYNGLKRVYMQL